MMTIDTRRRIDSARDILVGKVPDPKAQVEQITMALIYKFMDDMDKESEELGGKAQFFVNEYEKYSWSKLLDPRLGGFDRLNLYSEALQKMPQNPNLPQLFRNILKDAFLPYRDPETLNLFLKEITEFTYDHSEKLGDAFEYLLSVLGSQGDAGQFRTPRHIIDFIVEVVDPKKDETILDPACGTAGFLISGYKHISKQNSIHRSGDQLTPEEKTKLMQQFVGYDISPDMVKLSLVNMYLHSFPNPNVFEYDTLTSEERWDDTYDVIMANPPFMSPKGGIRPHKRFSTQASRSEVLFVDYIAEHLTTHGRAGVIVPEGIIFQSGTAYKALRKMLVEKYIFAVVSLPGGVFQPYSGVKTSILFMDKQLVKKADSILFIKVENDGFDLGAQRRAIEKNDLTKALCILQKYKQALNENSNVRDIFSDGEEPSLATVVEKVKIAKNGDYNLKVTQIVKTEKLWLLRWNLLSWLCQIDHYC
jgi:type I restriction enzyme M protein